MTRSRGPRERFLKEKRAWRAERGVRGGRKSSYSDICLSAPDPEVGLARLVEGEEESARLKVINGAGGDGSPVIRGLVAVHLHLQREC